MVRQGVQAVVVVAVAAAKALHHHVAGFVQHIASGGVTAAGNAAGAVVQRPAVGIGGEVAQIIVGLIQAAQVGDEAFGAVHPDGSDLIAVGIPQLHPDKAVLLTVQRHALIVPNGPGVHVGKQCSGVGVADLQAAVLRIQGDAVPGKADSIQRCDLPGGKVVQGITIVTVHVPGDHIPREIVAGQGVEFGNHAPVLGGQVPQLIGAAWGQESCRTVAAGLPVAAQALPGGRVVQDLVDRAAVCMEDVQFHPVVQFVRLIGNAAGRGGGGPIGLGAVLLLDSDPAVQAGVVVPFVCGKVCRAGVAVEHQCVPADDAAVGTLRHR